MTHPKVIVFGPTGAVGSAAARTAHRLEASVTLAMRDTAKSIPGVPSDNAPGYTRVHADLIDPSSVSTAVRESGATHAFIYMVHSSPDHMHGTIRALKDAGVSFVVFLSSFTVSGDLHAIRPEDIIDYLHAQVELNLESIFGREHFVALRPGSFASNELQYAPSFRKGRLLESPFRANGSTASFRKTSGSWRGRFSQKGRQRMGTARFTYTARTSSARGTLWQQSQECWDGSRR